MARIKDESVEAVKAAANIVEVVDYVAGMTDRFALSYAESL